MIIDEWETVDSVRQWQENCLRETWLDATQYLNQINGELFCQSFGSGCSLPFCLTTFKNKAVLTCLLYSRALRTLSIILSHLSCFLSILSKIIDSLAFWKSGLHLSCEFHAVLILSPTCSVPFFLFFFLNLICLFLSWSSELYNASVSHL